MSQRHDWLLVYATDLERLNELYQQKNSGRDLDDDDHEEYEGLVDQLSEFLPVSNT